MFDLIKFDFREIVLGIFLAIVFCYIFNFWNVAYLFPVWQETALYLSLASGLPVWLITAIVFADLVATVWLLLNEAFLKAFTMQFVFYLLLWALAWAHYYMIAQLAQF